MKTRVLLSAFFVVALLAFSTYASVVAATPETPENVVHTSVSPVPDTCKADICHVEACEPIYVVSVTSFTDVPTYAVKTSDTHVCSFACTCSHTVAAIKPTLPTYDARPPVIYLPRWQVSGTNYITRQVFKVT